MGLTANSSSVPGIVWEKTYGNSYGTAVNSISGTSDGGIIMAGYSGSFGTTNSTLYLAKTDANGNMIWNNTYGGPGDSVGTSVIRSDDGGYIATGYTTSYGQGKLDVYLLKTNSTGSIIWYKTYGGAENDMGYQVAKTGDGGYIIVGFTYSYTPGMAVFLIKTDKDGNMEWNKTYGGIIKDRGSSVIQTSDGGYAIVGQTISYGNKGNVYGVGGDKVWFIKTDPLGNEQWNATYGGTDFSAGYAVDQTPDAGYIIAGDTYSYSNGTAKAYLIKIDGNGNIQWNKTYGGEKDDALFSVILTPDGGYAATGSTFSYGNGGSDVYALKVNATGDKEWDASIGGSYDDIGHSILTASDGSYIIAGSSKSYSNNEIVNALLVELGNSTASTAPASAPFSSLAMTIVAIIVACLLSVFTRLRKGH